MPIRRLRHDSRRSESFTSSLNNTGIGDLKIGSDSCCFLSPPVLASFSLVCVSPDRPEYDCGLSSHAWKWRNLPCRSLARISDVAVELLNYEPQHDFVELAGHKWGWNQHERWESKHFLAGTATTTASPTTNGRRFTSIAVCWREASGIVRQPVSCSSVSVAS